MSKHSPSPWSYRARLSGSENHRGYLVHDEQGWRIAELSPVDEDGVTGSANARLFVAAPKLLGALQSLDRMTRGLDWCDVDEQARRWANARSAIAEATGEA